jgi:hypothetical protein
MPRNIGNCFFRDSVDGDLDGGGKTGEIRLSGHRNSQRRLSSEFAFWSLKVAARLVSRCPFSESADQPQLVKRGRT